MKKNIKNYFIIILLLFVLIELLNHPNLIINSVLYATKLWINNIFPTLFPFFVISDLLISYGFVDILGNIFNPIFNKLFKISKSSIFVIILSLFSGIPSNAKYIVEIYKKNYIDEKEATKILCFTFFSNPLFIFGALATSFLGNSKFGLFILFCHYFPNLIIGIILRNYHPIENNNYDNKRISNDNFGTIITNSLINCINTLLLVLGIITIFSIIVSIINQYDFIFINKPIISGIFELTQGLNQISILSIPLKKKIILSTMIISFGGLSSHLQINSIISETKIKYYPFFISRIFHSILSGLLSYLLFDSYINFLYLL